MTETWNDKGLKWFSDALWLANPSVDFTEFFGYKKILCFF